MRCNGSCSTARSATICAAALGDLRPFGDHPERSTDGCSPPTASNCRPAISKWRQSMSCRASMSACCRCCNSGRGRVIAGLQFVFYRTALGRAFRATADDPAVAQLMGLDNRHVFALAMALSLAIVAVAGVFLGSARQFRSVAGTGAADLRLRGCHYRRSRQPVGHARRRLILGVAQAMGGQIIPAGKSSPAISRF